MAGQGTTPPLRSPPPLPSSPSRASGQSIGSRTLHSPPPSSTHSQRAQIPKMLLTRHTQVPVRYPRQSPSAIMPVGPPRSPCAMSRRPARIPGISTVSTSKADTGRSPIRERRTPCSSLRAHPGAGVITAHPGAPAFLRRAVARPPAAAGRLRTGRSSPGDPPGARPSPRPARATAPRPGDATAPRRAR